MTISIVLNDKDAKLLQKGAESRGLTMSELAKRLVLERLLWISIVDND